MGALTPAAGFRGAPGEQGNGVKEQDFGGVAIKRILVCSGARVWGARRLHKDRGTWPRPSARCNPGSSFQDPLSTCAPGPAPGDVTSLRQPGGSRGAWGGGSGPQAGSPGIPTGPHTARTGGRRAPIPGLGEVGAGAGAAAGWGWSPRCAEVPGPVRSSRRRHRAPRPRPAGAVGDPGHPPSRPRVPIPPGLHPSGFSSLPITISLGPHLLRSPSPSIPILPGPPVPLPSAESDGAAARTPSEHKGREAWEHKAGAARPAPVSPVHPRAPRAPRYLRAPHAAPGTGSARAPATPRARAARAAWRAGRKPTAARAPPAGDVTLPPRRPRGWPCGEVRMRAAEGPVRRRGWVTCRGSL